MRGGPFLLWIGCITALLNVASEETRMGMCRGYFYLSIFILRTIEDFSDIISWPTVNNKD